jgi:NADPH:quinone reductase
VLDASFAAARAYTRHVVSALGWGTHNIAPLSFRNATYSGVFTLAPMVTGRGRDHHGEILREATALADVGVLAPRLDPRRFTLATVDKAHEVVATGTGSGKIVVGIAERGGLPAVVISRGGSVCGPGCRWRRRPG